MIGEYLGQTGPKTRSLLVNSLESVLFIDEAYSLTPCPGQQQNDAFSEEAVAELINFIDKYIGCIIKAIIGVFNDKDMFNNQAGDMLNLANVIAEDAVLFDKQYNKDMIQMSFMKFCADKGHALTFH
jgi:hypothetical protein